jgi:hypothetical protein
MSRLATTLTASLTAKPMPGRVGSAMRAAGQRLSMLERVALAGGGVMALALVLALAVTCQASVAKGERLRADQAGALRLQ